MLHDDISDIEHSVVEQRKIEWSTASENAVLVLSPAREHILRPEGRRSTTIYPLSLHVQVLSAILPAAAQPVAPLSALPVAVCSLTEMNSVQEVSGHPCATLMSLQWW